MTATNRTTAELRELSRELYDIAQPLEGKTPFGKLVRIADRLTTLSLSLPHPPALGGIVQEEWRPTQAVQDVVAERQRQIEKEGWPPDHDDEHSDGALADAGACYAMTERATAKVDDLFLAATNQNRLSDYPYEWPFDAEWWKPKDRRRNLIRAAALILAEIERLDRATPRQSKKEG